MRNFDPSYELVRALMGLSIRAAGPNPHGSSLRRETAAGQLTALLGLLLSARRLATSSLSNHLVCRPSRRARSARATLGLRALIPAEAG
jgi:hypothetical protein